MSFEIWLSFTLLVFLLVLTPGSEPVSISLHRFAEDIPLSGKERIAERSGATVQGLDAAGQRNVPARRVRFGDVLRRYTA
ncbi:hypothetical protein UF64_16385 [Thalassospira sp. HJ]|nr:hypothetical protein UF64_16385 [Thalassospira sp. HJ]